MGSGQGGGLRFGQPSLQANIDSVASKYGFGSKSGLLGVPGTGSARVIVSKNPKETAKALYKELSRGGDSKVISKLKGEKGGDVKNHKMTVFPDGSSVYYRPNSKSGSPSVNIKTTGPRGKNYKIHFEKTGWQPGKG